LRITFRGDLPDLLVIFVNPLAQRFDGGQQWETVSMPKRSIRVVKRLSSTPSVGVRTACSKQFTVPTTALSKTKDAWMNLQQQFDQHKCERLDAS
jgi:hypothetical protein